MAILTEGRLLITDASNVPINGGKARIYDTGTTNLSSVYSDAALVTPLTNPVVANSSGFTPVIFGAEGTVVDVTYLTSADATVTGRTYVGLSLVGADNGLFSRTLADNTRVKITGAGGIVLFQASSASPDDVGGFLTLEGHAGTQGDTLTLDFATTNTTGALTVNSKKLTGIVQTAATAFTAVASVDIDLTNTPTGVIGWRVMAWFTTAASLSLQGRFSYDGGSTYKSGASDYGYGSSRSDNAGTTLSNANTAATLLNLVPNMNATANRPALFECTILTPTSGSDDTVLMGICASQEAASIAPMSTTMAGNGRGTYGRATNFRLLFTGTTATGKYRVAPIYGLGE